MISQRLQSLSALAASLVAWAICDVSAAVCRSMPASSASPASRKAGSSASAAFASRSATARFHGAGQKDIGQDVHLGLGLDHVGGQIDVFQRH